MRLTDFCDCTISRHEHLLERSDSRGDPDRFRGLVTFAGAKAPPNGSSGCAPDVALPASTRSTTPPSSSDEGASAGCSWWVSRSRNPSDGAPSRRRFRPCARRKNEPLTLPVAAPSGRSLPTPPEPLPPPLRQKRWVSRPEAPSLDECPLGACFRLHLERGPATEPRVLPPEPGFRRSFAPRYDEEELDPAAFASSSPASARRHTPLVDFCNRNDPQARPANRRNPPRDLAPPAFAGSADAWNGSSAPFGATRPSCQGSGTGWDVRLSPRRPPAPLSALARRESLAPTRLARTPPVVDS